MRTNTEGKIYHPPSTALLDTGLPAAYAPVVYQQKCAALFEHFYEAYPDQDTSVYAVAG